MFTHAFELDVAVGEGVRRVGAVIAAGGLSPVLGGERREMRISRETVMDEREIKSLRARQYLPIKRRTTDNHRLRRITGRREGSVDGMAHGNALGFKPLILANDDLASPGTRLAEPII